MQLARRMASHAATAGGWLPYLRLAIGELRQEGVVAKLRSALNPGRRPAGAAASPPDVRRFDAAMAAATLRELRFADVAEPAVSILIPACTDGDRIIECLAAIHRHKPQPSCEVLVIHDGSTRSADARLATIPGVRWVRSEADRGWMAACNHGAGGARGRYLHFLAPGTQVQPGWLDALMNQIEQTPRCGLVGSRLLFPDGRLQQAGARLVRGTDQPVDVESIGQGSRGTDPRFQHARDIECCSAASLLIRRDLFAGIGGFDPALAPFESADLAFKVRKAGYRVRYEPASAVVHELDGTAAPREAGNEIARTAARFAERWGKELQDNARIRLIAFYLPQYHPIPENDAWWGAGFTEWTNVRKALPNFPGHDQPHVPGELGYYDLRQADVRERQAALARDHGVHGFCYYYYWFDGKRLLHEPLDQVIASGRPDFPFCVCWANENWTRTWDGLDQHVLMAQQHSPADDLAFIGSLFPALRDARYIRIDGRPLLLVYKVNLLPEPAATARRWRDACRAAGIGEIYLACVHANADPRRNTDPRTIGFDAAVEFPPAGKGINVRAPEGARPSFRGLCYDYAATTEHMLSWHGDGHVLLRGVMPSWDNTARRQDSGHVFLGASPQGYGRWLRAVLAWTARLRAGDERIVFVNAWNEWAEGNHLEPDQSHGRGFLEETRAALESYRYS